MSRFVFAYATSQCSGLSSEPSLQSTTSSHINCVGTHSGLLSHFQDPSGQMLTPVLHTIPTASSGRQLWTPQLLELVKLRTIRIKYQRKFLKYNVEKYTDNINIFRNSPIKITFPQRSFISSTLYLIH